MTEKAPQSKEPRGLLALAGREARELIQRTSLGRLINRIIISQELVDKTQERTAKKSQEAEWLRRGDTVIGRRQNPNYEPSDDDKVVLKRVKEIQRGEAEQWQNQTAGALEQEIVSTRGRDGRMLIVSWALGTCDLPREAGRLSSVLGAIEALKIKRHNIAESDAVAEIVERLDEMMILEASGANISFEDL